VAESDEVRVDATVESVDWVTTALGAVGFDGQVDVLAGSAEWPLIVRARPGSAAGARALWRRLAEPLTPLQRIGLVGRLRLGAAEGDEQPAAAPVRLPVRVDERLVVHFGEGDAPARDHDVVLRIAPGLGFGSGLHPGTLVCLRLVGRYSWPGASALDLGCGNGVVSVALAKLGARVVAVDNDASAVAAAAETLRRNGVAERVSLGLGSLGRGRDLGHWLGWGEVGPTPSVDASEGFDLIAANILSSVHIGLAADYREALRPNGVVVTAGFTVQQAQDTSDALVAVGLDCVDLTQEGDFVALAHRRPV
jgi:ribosomal protein L11 methyltransferase